MQELQEAIDFYGYKYKQFLPKNGIPLQNNWGIFRISENWRIIHNFVS